MVKILATLCTFLAILGQSTAIYKGRRAIQGELPYQLGIEVAEISEVLCGATLVSVGGVQVGLTSANCTNFGNITVGGDVFVGPIGSHFQQIRNVSNIVGHPSYSNETLENNIAILFFEPFELTQNIQPAKIPQPNQLVNNVTVTVSGWGSPAAFNDPERWPELNVANMTSIDDASCKSKLTEIGSTISERMLCSESEGKPNQRDNGGPAVTTDGYVVGVFSLNLNHTGIQLYRIIVKKHEKMLDFLKCLTDETLPSVFIEVSFYKTWIEDTVQSYKNGWTTPNPVPKLTSEDTPTDQKGNGAENHQTNKILLQISLMLFITLCTPMFVY